MYILNVNSFFVAMAQQIMLLRIIPGYIDPEIRGNSSHLE